MSPFSSRKTERKSTCRAGSVTKCIDLCNGHIRGGSPSTTSITTFHWKQRNRSSLRNIVGFCLRQWTLSKRYISSVDFLLSMKEDNSFIYSVQSSCDLYLHSIHVSFATSPLICCYFQLNMNLMLTSVPFDSKEYKCKCSPCIPK